MIPFLQFIFTTCKKYFIPAFLGSLIGFYKLSLEDIYFDQSTLQQEQKNIAVINYYITVTDNLYYQKIKLNEFYTKKLITAKNYNKQMNEIKKKEQNLFEQLQIVQRATKLHLRVKKTLINQIFQILIYSLVTILSFNFLQFIFSPLFNSLNK